MSRACSQRQQGADCGHRVIWRDVQSTVPGLATPSKRNSAKTTACESGWLCLRDVTAQARPPSGSVKRRWLCRSAASTARAACKACCAIAVTQVSAQNVKNILGEHVTVQIARRGELHAFKVKPKR